MFKRFLVLALALAFVSSAHADTCGGCPENLCCPDADQYTIMIISDSGYSPGGILDADGKPEYDGNGALDGKYVDEELVTMLQNCGFNVNTFGMGGRYRRVGKDQYGYANDWWQGLDDRLAPLLAADLVIVSKFASSGVYARNEAPGASTTVSWNTLPVPLLSQNAHLIRGQGSPYGGSTKWGWTNGRNGRQFQGSKATDMAPVPVSHPAYSWICPTELFDYSGNPGNGAKDTDGDHDGREPDLCIGDWVPEATILGYLENDPTNWGASEAGGAPDYPNDEYQDHPILVYIPAGTDFDSHNSNGNTTPGQEVYGWAGADRGYLGIWSYDGSAEYYWGMDTTSCYKHLFMRMVCDMIPEPATIALLGLGGLALLRKRR
jgi:hypothetical protein